MSAQLIPENTPGLWDTVIYKGATWPSSTVEMLRDGVAVIPVSATLTITDPAGTVQVTLAASISGGGIMTFGPISAATTAAYTWSYGNLLVRVVESGNVKTDLLAGNATCVDRSD